MRNFLLGAATATLLLSAPAAIADTAPSAQLYNGVYRNADRPTLEHVSVQLYVSGGRNFCWYYDGWNGPGYYWCGYSSRAGFGWGGGSG